MIHPRAAFGVTPSRGHRLQPGQAGSAAVVYETAQTTASELTKELP